MKNYIVTEPNGLRVQVRAESPVDAARKCSAGGGHPIKVGTIPITHAGQIFGVFEIPEIVE